MIELTVNPLTLPPLTVAVVDAGDSGGAIVTVGGEV